jgi:tRNA wybutosine-synthesizing protein 3
LEKTREAWNERKREAWLKIFEDLEIGYLDVELLPLLVLLNRDVNLFTTSSCSGRITVMDANYPWERDETAIVFKTHGPIASFELEFMYKVPPHKRYWLIVSGPIIHIYSRSIKLALKILQLARRVGFKHSGVMNYSSERGAFIELVTGVYVTQLIRTREIVLVNQRDLEHLARTFNQALIEGKRRLNSLYQELSRHLPTVADEHIEEDARLKGLIPSKMPLEIFVEVYSERFKRLGIEVPI